MNKVKNWVGELTTTTGTGDIFLGGALKGFAPFSVMGDGEVWYTITDGLNREAGIGTLTGGVLARTDIRATLFDSAYSEPGTAIPLSGAADVYCTFNASAFNDISDQLAEEITAAIVSYNPTAPLTSANVQGALDELASAISGSNPVTELDDLTDVSINTSLAENMMLEWSTVYNAFVPVQPVFARVLNDLSDVNYPDSPTDGLVLGWNSTLGAFTTVSPTSVAFVNMGGYTEKKGSVNAIDASDVNVAVITDGATAISVSNIPAGIYTLTLHLAGDTIDLSGLSVKWQGAEAPVFTTDEDLIFLTTIDAGVTWLGSAALGYA